MNKAIKAYNKEAPGLMRIHGGTKADSLLGAMRYKKKKEAGLPQQRGLLEVYRRIDESFPEGE